jgi:hypothetical protein
MLNYVCQHMCRRMPKLQIFVDPKRNAMRCDQFPEKGELCSTIFVNICVVVCLNFRFLLTQKTQREALRTIPPLKGC